MREDKAKLLRSLTIDRSTDEPARPARRRWVVPAVVAGCALVALAAYALSAFRTQEPSKQVATQQVAQAQTPQPPAVTSSEAGNLSASGYVVARRKATVAAEITGKVIGVFIDEGMTVA